MKILVINSGSSSVKFQLYRMPQEKMLVKGSAEKNGSGDTDFSFSSNNKTTEDNWPDFNYGKIMEKILKELQNPELDIIQSLDEIEVVGHRLIHGGEKSECCVEITDELISYMKSSIELAPLHYPPNLKGIEAVSEQLPEVFQTGVFDTSFHQTLPRKAFLYGIPLKWYEDHKIRRYGFHGTSHKYVSQRACEITGTFYGKSKIISCHLGNGASIAAIKNGKSIDTSMGLTPVEGLLMGTRSGDIDAGVLVHLQQNFDFSSEDIQQLINKKSGLLGLSGVSSDYREVEEAAEKGNENAKTAIDVYCHRIKKYIGSYLAVLGGANILVFTGGVGENSAAVRKEVCNEMEWAGLSVSAIINREMNGKEAVISETGSKIKVLIVPTNEELMIARESAELAKSKLNK